MEQEAQTTTAFFKVDPRLASLLGETYRSSELAIKELVDNCWDADGDSVWISLPAAMTSDPITVRDDGTGMTEQEVKSEYLSVARDRTRTKGDFTAKHKRPVKGRRGIGKFAGLMIADHMSVESCARGRRTKLEIPRRQVVTAARDLEKVPLPIRASDCGDHERGTTVILAELHHRLTFPDPEKLKELLVLEYGREESFAIWVNNERVSIDDIPGEPFTYETTLPNAGPVRLFFKISPEKKSLRNSGIAVRVKSKVVGKPTVFGLNEDVDVPRPTLRRLYGEVIADGLTDEVTADWSTIVENSKGYAEIEEFVRPLLKAQLQRTFRQEFSAQHARVQREINQRLARIPANRRDFAKKAMERIMLQFYGEKEERIQPIVNVVLDALEQDEYWQVMKEIERTSRAEVQLFADSLSHFGLIEMALIARQAQNRLKFLSYLDQLSANPKTREAQMHTALQNNLWVFGAEFSMLSSNITLGRVVEEYTGKKFTGVNANKRPDLLLLSRVDSKHLLLEFKRPSHVITRDDQAQAEKYRDDLSQFRPMEIILVGKEHDSKISDAPLHLKMVSYNALISRSRSEMDWLLKELTNVRGVRSASVTTQ